MDHFVVTAIHRDFSSSNNNKWEISSDELPNRHLPYLFYANGNCEDNEGYVSVIFSISKYRLLKSHKFIPYDKISFYVSVVDVAGNKRFTQSFGFAPADIPNEVFQFGLERYLKRVTLLNDPAELLPDDCLTICLDVETYSYFDIPELISTDFPSVICREENETYIHLDTDFGRELCRVSEVFRFASDLPMMESKTRKVRIKEEEYDTFMTIFGIFYGYMVLHITIDDMCKLYRVADKYDIHPVIETCRQFVKAVLIATDDPKFRELLAESVPAVLLLADDYTDDDLKEILQIYLESKENFGTNYDALGNHLKEKFHTEWEVQKELKKEFYAPSIFTMRRRVIKPIYQFYR